MKKLLLSTALILTTVISFSQFGARGGLNLATWAGDGVDEDGKKSLVRPYVGFYYNIGLASQLSIQPEVYFSAQGVKYDFSGFEEKISTNYINFTPFFRYNIPSGFFLGTGPYIGFLVGAKFKEDGEPDVDIKDELKEMDFGWGFGAGFSSKGGLGFDIRYNLGFSTIDDDPDPADIKNRFFSIGIHYGIAPSKKGPDSPSKK